MCEGASTWKKFKELALKNETNLAGKSILEKKEQE